MATITGNGIVGPVPFVDADDAVEETPLSEEYAGAGSALPSNPKLRHPVRCYQGTWVLESWVPGIIAVQETFVPRRGDVVLASLPKCGTTWLKGLAFAIMSRGSAYPPNHPDHPLLRLNPHDCVPLMELLFGRGCGSKVMEALPSPRLMATHMHHSILPASIRDNPDCKIIYVCRDPKDMLVSLWHFVRRVRPRQSDTFADLFESACEGNCLSSPIWDHILGYWNASKASPETVLFLRYEDMLRDPVSNVRKIASFVGQPFTQGEEEAWVPADVVELCGFDKMKRLEANKTMGVFSSFYSSNSYFRKGQAGDWANHMTPEMAARLDAILQERLRGSGLSFM